MPLTPALSRGEREKLSLCTICPLSLWERVRVRGNQRKTMHTTHTTLHLSHHTLHRVDFDSATFTPADLFWLPHHAQLQSAGRKRQCEHLAGRLAAFYALQDINIRAIPGIDRKSVV